MVRINKITAELPCLVLAKVETFNPGHSIKDRMAVKMLADAEAAGRITEGGQLSNVRRAIRVWAWQLRRL